MAETNTVDRKFYYYDTELFYINEKNQVIKYNNQKKQWTDIFKYLKEIQDEIRKDIKLQKNIEIDIENGDKVYFIVDDILETKVRFKMVLCRKNALPYVEENGILKYLTNFVDGDFSLAELTHCVLFTDRGILGAEYNHTGARASLLKSYIPQLIDWIGAVSCTAKLDEDTFDKISEEKNYSLFSIVIRNDGRMKETLENMKPLFFRFSEVQDVDTYEITLKRRKTKIKEGFNLPFTKDEIEDLIRNHRDGFDKFVISQESISNDKIDLLNDKLVCQKSLTKTINKTIDSKDAYKTIERFYETKIEGLDE